MPRRARIVVPGLPLHVVQRGNNKAVCFFSDDDHRFYLHQLARLSGQTACDVHAYCLMTNHVHLLLTPRHADACARLMRRLDLLHSQYLNRKYRRTGSLWEGRFRSCIVDSETYLLQCYRYIESNPVRAGMVSRPDEYSWSSYGFNALGDESSWIEPHAEYLRLGSSAMERRGQYRALFDLDVDARGIRDATNGNHALGSKSFLDALGKRLGRRVAPGRPGRPAQAGETHAADLFAPGENVVRP